MLRIRLRRVGKKKQPMYRIVVADSRAPRDGAFVESIGQYHPLEDPSRIVLDQERVRHWLDRGAQPSDRVAKILAIEGIRELPAKLQTRIALGEQRAQDAAAEKAKARAEEAAPPPAEAPAAEVPPEPAAAEAPPEPPAAEAPEPPAAEAPTEEPATEPEAEAEAPAKASEDSGEEQAQG